MAAVSHAGMSAAESRAMEAGWTEAQLLTLAGTQLGYALARRFPGHRTGIAYLGKGHNAGDALVALGILKDQFGWDIFVRAAVTPESMAPLTRQKLEDLASCALLSHPPDPAQFQGPILLLDGLAGCGLKGPLRSPLRELAEEMAILRQNFGALVAAVDLPSGVDPDLGTIHPGAVTADVTFTIANAKIGLLQSHAAPAVGALAIVPVACLTSEAHAEMEAIAPQNFSFGKSPRPFDFHKGQAGRVGIIAGSIDFPGAAVLAATGALRGGAGLITLHVPTAALPLISAKCPPEIMIRGFSDPCEALATRQDAWVIGCGLSLPDSAFGTLLRELSLSETPSVLDAEALNALARLGALDLLTERQILTPHPGEFARLAPDLAALPREAAARAFTQNYPAILLLKGARTLVTCGAAPLLCNTTGTPGMASGGQGDALAGVIGAFLAAGNSPLDAAALGAWICGRASEIALSQAHLSPESLTASDTLHHLGAAMKDWKCAHR